jgi:hypothetical protein
MWFKPLVLWILVEVHNWVFVGSKQPGFVVCGGCFTILIQMGSRDSCFFIDWGVYFSDRDEISPRINLVLQEHFWCYFRRSGCLISGENSIRISKEIQNMIEQLAEREKQLQYTPKNKKTKGVDYSSYHRHWNKSVNKWVGHCVCLIHLFF